MGNDGPAPVQWLPVAPSSSLLVSRQPTPCRKAADSGCQTIDLFIYVLKRVP